IMGTNAVGGMIVAGPEGFRKSQYRKFNIKSTDITPGDDFGMMREVLRRRFARLVKEAPRGAAPAAEEPAPVADAPLANEEAAPGAFPADALEDPAPLVPDEADATSPWPDLVFIDGGLGQLNAARAILEELGITDVPLVGIAKGLDREAGREQFFIPGRQPFRLEPRDPVLYFVQRLRDEAHRFAIGSHRARRKKDITDAGLQAIPGVGPTRKRALLRHFGTLKAIEQASLADLEHVPGINASTAQAIYGYFHSQPGR
ncbi:MAG TPA: helix-hairpin-helix domain-containing protein, partial [Xanthobacteraceae bacterium]|nr:helix-hairpin-helix domain-containing protein [Xanthobacteraceae bacterium]